ncbi:MAG: hypothetical protein IJI25_03465 [Eubacterium sp.]|nr:hypothetical protein [Eubacterium sp.]
MPGSNYKWYKLDNAATIVPATARGSDTRVFRVTCELKEEVDGEFLQDALNEALLEFPHFNVVLRKGFFWYYLDGTDIRPLVRTEDLPACSPLYFSGRRSLLFRVNYYRRRINLEMFHALADGTGGFMFMRKLVMIYCHKKYGTKVPSNADISSSADEKNKDAFDHFYSRERNRNQLKDMMSHKAYKIRQDKDDNMQNHLVEGTISARAFVDLAHRFNTTAGILTTALYIEAVVKSMAIKDHRYPVVISVPVNLRQYFPSETTRNFFGVINIVYKAENYNGSIESILPTVKEAFSSQLSQENIRNTMNGYSALQHNIGIKMLPLFLKDLGILYFTHRTRKGTTATLSNLGKIVMPDELKPYIDRFSGFMSTQNMQVCVSTYEDKMVFGAVSAYSEHRVLLAFFRKLVELGLEVEIGSNDYDAQDSKEE